MIAHPDSPFKGKHYPYPVESVDIVPTVLELLRLPRSRSQICSDRKNKQWKCPKLDGKSLAPVVLGVTIDSVSSAAARDGGGGRGGGALDWLKTKALAAESGNKRGSPAGRATGDTGGAMRTVGAAAGHRGAVGTSLSGGMLGGLRGAHGRSRSTTAAVSAAATAGAGATAGAASNVATGAAGAYKVYRSGDKRAAAGVGSKRQHHPGKSAASARRIQTAERRQLLLSPKQQQVQVQGHDQHGQQRRRRLELSTMQHAAADSLVGYVQAAGSVGGLVMPKLRQDYAISQSIRCAKLKDIPPRQERIQNSTKLEVHHLANPRKHMWDDCDSRKHDATQECVLGYSMRTPEYRYTAYLRFDRTLQLPDVESLPYEEELFDHKNGTMLDFTHREIHNLAYRSAFGIVVARLRTQLIEEVVKPLFRKKHGNDKIFDTVAVA